ncbi:MAG: alpha/beta hydrolase [Hyphomicrobiales bacterium]|nr:alpha/beta hydrolase [Hyphomicrobiales bacterium]
MTIHRQTLEVATEGGIARKIAYIATNAHKAGFPGLFWLSGFKSDMASTKASIIADWARDWETAYTRFDYSGHGVSDGDIEDFTIGDWLLEAETVFLEKTGGPQIVIGSSMGGWLALLLARSLVLSGAGDRLKALILIAPAWDMTEELMWKKFTPEAHAALERDGVYYQPSEYGEPYALTRALIEEGRNHLLAGRRLDPGCPVRILQGLRDPDVPWQHAVALMELLEAEDVHMTLIKDAEHRLSRDSDLEVLKGMVEKFVVQR